MTVKTVYFLMVLATLSWAGAFITGKWAILEIAPVTLIFLRFSLALPFIFAILAKAEPQNIKPRGKQWYPLIFLGIVGTVGYHIFFFYSLKYTTAINAALIGSTMPSITAILCFLLGRESISRPRTLGIILALFGIIAVITDGNISMLLTLELNLGDILMLLAVLSFSLYGVFSRSFMTDYSLGPVMATAYTFLICTLVTAPYAVWDLLNGAWNQITLKGWLSVWYMTLFSSVLGYLCQMISFQKLGPSRTAVFANLVPVFTIILAVIFLGEVVTLFKLTVACLIVSGVYLATHY